MSAGQRPDQVERLVATRIERQEILRRDEPPDLLVLIAERVLREPAGGPEVMRDQLRHLCDMAVEPHLTIQIVPAAARVYVMGAFTLLGYPEGGDLGYVEAAAAGHGGLIEQPEQVHRLRLIFDQIRSSALPAEDSLQLMHAVLEDM